LILDRFLCHVQRAGRYVKLTSSSRSLSRIVPRDSFVACQRAGNDAGRSPTECASPRSAQQQQQPQHCQ